MMMSTRKTIWPPLLWFAVTISPAFAAAPNPAQESASPSQPLLAAASREMGLTGILDSEGPNLLHGLDLLASLPGDDEAFKVIREQVQQMTADLAALHQGSAADAAQPLDLASQQQILDRLTAAQQPLESALAKTQGDVQRQLRVFTHRLGRRLGMLRATIEALEVLAPPATEELNQHRQQLQERVQTLETLLARWSTGEGWRRYLQLSEVATLAAADARESRAEQAARLLEKFDSEKLPQAQRAALDRPDFSEVRNQLSRYAESLRRRDEFSDAAFRDKLHQLWQNVEACEMGAATDAAPALRHTAHELAALGAAGQRVVGAVNEHYLARNVWVAVSRALIQKFLPGTTVQRGPIRTQRGGTSVSGEQATRATAQVRFHDSQPASLSLDLSGTVETSIVASQERADVAADINSRFTASRRITVTNDGFLRADPAQIDVRASSDVQGTDVRGALIFGRTARRRAAEIGQRELERSEPETEQRIAREVLDRFNPEVDKFVRTVNEQLEQFREPGGKPKSGIQSTSRTTEHWLLVNMTVAEEDQLAATSPRLPTPAGTLGALQFHASMIRNLGREFAGKTYTREQLSEKLTQRFAASGETGKDSQEPAPPTPPKEPLTIVFAEQAPIDVAFQGGVAEFTLRMAMLEGRTFKTGPRQIRVRYRPMLDARDARLVRDGDIEVTPLDNAATTTPDPNELAEVRRVLAEIFKPQFDTPRAISLSSGKDKKTVSVRILSIDLEDDWFAISLGE